MTNPRMAGSAEGCRGCVWLLIVWFPRIGIHTDQLRINGGNRQCSLAWRSREMNWRCWGDALGLSRGFSPVFVRGVSFGSTTSNDFSFLILPHRETAEAMAYSLSLSLLYLGLLCGNELLSARGSKLFTPGTALTSMSKTGIVSL